MGAGLLGGVDNVLTGGQQAKGQGGLLGGVGNALGSTTQVSLQSWGTPP